MTTLVVTDLDGTFWDNDLRCHPATTEAARHLIERDDVVLLAATGRRRNSAHLGFERNGVTMPAVLLNGAIGHDFVTDVRFHEVTFDLESLAHVLDHLHANALGPILYSSDDRAVAYEGVSTCVQHLEQLAADLSWSTIDEVRLRTDVLGMSVLGVEEALVRPVVGALEGHPHVQLAAYADHLYPPYSLMLAPAAVTKEAGIRAFCDHAGLTPDRIVALGDGGNDLEMLAMADVALVVEEADPRATELADHRIPGPVHGGWAAVLDHL